MPLTTNFFLVLLLLLPLLRQVALHFDRTIKVQKVALYDVGMTLFVLVVLLVTSGVLNDTINRAVSAPLQRMFGMIMQAMPG